MEFHLRADAGLGVRELGPPTVSRTETSIRLDVVTEIINVMNESCHKAKLAVKDAEPTESSRH